MHAEIMLGRASATIKLSSSEPFVDPVSIFETTYLQKFLMSRLSRAFCLVYLICTFSLNLCFLFLVINKDELFDQTRMLEFLG